MFSMFGGKTKFFAVVAAVVQALESTDVIPQGAIAAILEVVKAVAAAGVVFGFRDAVSKVGK